MHRSVDEIELAHGSSRAIIPLTHIGLSTVQFAAMRDRRVGLQNVQLADWQLKRNARIGPQ